MRRLRYMMKSERRSVARNYGGNMPASIGEKIIRFLHRQTKEIYTGGSPVLLRKVRAFMAKASAIPRNSYCGDKEGILNPPTVGMDEYIHSINSTTNFREDYTLKECMNRFLAGNLPHGERISLDLFDLIKGKRIIGTWGGETQPDRDIPLYVDIYLSGKLKLDRLITHIYNLDGINQALEDLEHGKVGRTLIDMTADRSNDES